MHQAKTSIFTNKKLMSLKIAVHVSFAVKRVFLKDLESIPGKPH